MDKLVEVLRDFLLDSKKSIGRRLGNAVVIGVVLLILDFTFGITKSIHYSNKLSKLEKIHQLKEKYHGDILTIQMLDNMKMETVNSAHYMDHFDSVWSSLDSSENNAPIINDAQNTPQITSPKLSIWLTIFSSSLVFVIFSLIALTAPVWSKNYSFKNIRESITIAIAFALVSALSTELAMKIPIMFDDYSWINYILFLIIHLASLFGLIFIGKKSMEEQKASAFLNDNPPQL